MRTQVAIGAGTTVLAITTNDQKQFLRDVLSWLVVNSMRVDGIQFSLLCEQSVSNIWRKRSFNMLRADYPTLDKVIALTCASQCIVALFLLRSYTSLPLFLLFYTSFLTQPLHVLYRSILT